MNIKITPVFSGKDIQKDIQRTIDGLHRVAINRITEVGLQFVTDARIKTKARGGFDDITGNLRSSIGFIIIYDGKIVNENFEASDTGTDKATGLGLGRSYAEKIGKDYPKGYALITVAGMEYAAAVEALNYDVISGSTLGAASKMEGVWKKVAEAMQ